MSVSEHRSLLLGAPALQGMAETKARGPGVDRIVGRRCGRWCGDAAGVLGPHAFLHLASGGRCFRPCPDDAGWRTAGNRRIFVFAGVCSRTYFYVSLVANRSEIASGVICVPLAIAGFVIGPDVHACRRAREHRFRVACAVGRYWS